MGKAAGWGSKDSARWHGSVLELSSNVASLPLVTLHSHLLPAPFPVLQEPPAQACTRDPGRSSKAELLQAQADPGSFLWFAREGQGLHQRGPHSLARARQMWLGLQPSQERCPSATGSHLCPLPTPDEHISP
ncbi:unnamed protein product [Eretmochelys imbricata]